MYQIRIVSIIIIYMYLFEICDKWQMTNEYFDFSNRRKPKNTTNATKNSKLANDDVSVIEYIPNYFATIFTIFSMCPNCFQF